MIVYEEDVDEFLAHYGVKGQRWGVRNVARNATSSRSAKVGTKVGTKVRRKIEGKPPVRKKAEPSFRDKRQQKRTARIQKRIDFNRKVASGRGTRSDRIFAGAMTIPVADLVMGKGSVRGSQRLLNRQQKMKNKIQRGEARTSDILARSFGMNYRDLNFEY